MLPILLKNLKITCNISHYLCIEMAYFPAEFYEICRLCFSARGRNSSLVDDGDIAMKMTSCLSIVIQTEKDDLPTKICDNCKENLDRFHKFRADTCMRTEFLRSLKHSPHAVDLLLSLVRSKNRLSPQEIMLRINNAIRGTNKMEVDIKHEEEESVKGHSGMNGYVDTDDSDNEGRLRIADEDQYASVDMKVEKEEDASSSRSAEENSERCLRQQVIAPEPLLVKPKSEQNSLLRSLMSGTPHSLSFTPVAPIILGNRTNKQQQKQSQKTVKRLTNGRRKQSRPSRASEPSIFEETHTYNGCFDAATNTVVLGPAGPTVAVFNGNFNAKSISVQTVEQPIRSQDSISQLLEAANYTDRQERVAYAGEVTDVELGSQSPPNWINVQASNKMQQQPQQQKQPQLAKRGNTTCTNCGTAITTIWRRGLGNVPVCNACGLYFKLHGIHRPQAMRRDKIHPRKRKSKQGNSNGTQAENNTNQEAVECTSGTSNSDNDECDNMLKALRRQIQPHLVFAALQQTYKRDEEDDNDDAPLNLAAGQQVAGQ